MAWRAKRSHLLRATHQSTFAVICLKTPSSEVASTPRTPRTLSGTAASALAADPATSTSENVVGRATAEQITLPALPLLCNSDRDPAALTGCLLVSLERYSVDACALTCELTTFMLRDKLGKGGSLERILRRMQQTFGGLLAACLCALCLDDV